jgi:hypothetical protein
LVAVNPFHITNVAIQTNNVLITWTAPIGSTNIIQAAPQPNGVFTNISPPIMMSGSLTNYADTSAATNFPARFYRVSLLP